MEQKFFPSVRCVARAIAHIILLSICSSQQAASQPSYDLRTGPKQSTVVNQYENGSQAPDRLTQILPKFTLVQLYANKQYVQARIPERARLSHQHAAPCFCDAT